MEVIVTKNKPQLCVKLPDGAYEQLKLDAEYHREKISTRARHLIVDALMDKELIIKAFSKAQRPDSIEER